jgi:hypothetical protein
MRTINKIITEVSSKYGAPMGRANVGSQEQLKSQGYTGKIFDCRVPMSNDGAYDRGGAYWGIASELRVKYTKDLKYIEFYRK